MLIGPHAALTREPCMGLARATSASCCGATATSASGETSLRTPLAIGRRNTPYANAVGIEYATRKRRVAAAFIFMIDFILM
jgi:hypothetical protein